jgi:hypothetical protein
MIIIDMVVRGVYLLKLELAVLDSIKERVARIDKVTTPMMVI